MREYKNSPTRKPKDINVGRACLPEREDGGWAIPGGGAIYDRQDAIGYAVAMDQVMAAGTPGQYLRRLAA